MTSPVVMAMGGSEALPADAAGKVRCVRALPALLPALRRALAALALH